MKWPLFFAFLYVGSAAAFDIEVELQNFSSDEGNIQYLLFNDDEGFPDKDKKSFKQGTIPAEIARKKFIITDVPKGNYAISLFHDKNKNNHLDTNFIGIPKEAFGFSNNPRILFGPPSYKKTKFSIAENLKVEIKMKEM